MDKKTAAYAAAYEAGWRYASRATSLDRADADGRSANDAWLDGYLDRSVGREKWHLRECPDHDRCP